MTIIKTIIVDDEPRIRRGIERIVRSCGEEWEIIGSFSDGLEAYEEIVSSNLEFDLLITDVQMPEMDGLTLLKELKKRYSFFSLIISGFDDFKYLQTAIREGANNYMLKPVDREQFRTQMDELKEKINHKREEKREWEKVQDRASQLTYTKQVQLLREVTWNEDTDLALLNWTSQFPSGSYKLMFFSIDQIFSKTRELNADEWENWKFALTNITEELLDKKFENEGIRYWHWKGLKYGHWLLLQDEHNAETLSFSNMAKQFANDMKNGIQQFTPFTVSIALGNEFTDLSLLPILRDQLQSLLQFRIIHGGNRVFELDLIKTISDERPKGITSPIYKHTQQIIHMLERGEEEEIVKILQVYFCEIEKLSSPDQIQEVIYYLFISTINRWMEHEGLKKDPHLLPEAVQLSEQAANFTQLKDFVKHWILNIAKKMQETTGENSNSIQQAKVWIKNNLSENITIKKIANQVHMNPTYLCECFKSQTGETVLDYVTKARLEKAKELLGNTELKIYDISCQVGYQDTKYFSRLFKQWIGQSPSQFRESHSISHS